MTYMCLGVLICEMGVPALIPPGQAHTVADDQLVLPAESRAASCGPCSPGQQVGVMRAGSLTLRQPFPLLYSLWLGPLDVLADGCAAAGCLADGFVSY